MKKHFFSIFFIFLLILTPFSLALDFSILNLDGKLIDGGDDRFLFAGKERDATGLDYLGARYYNSFSALFTQPDQKAFMLQHTLEMEGNNAFI